MRNKQSKTRNYSKTSPLKKSPNLKNPPKPLQSTPSTKQNSSDILPSVIGTVAQGFAFGSGSALAHQGINSIINKVSSDDCKGVNNDNNNDNQNLHKLCNQIFIEYRACIDSNLDKEVCKKYEGQVKQCMEIS